MSGHRTENIGLPKSLFWSLLSMCISSKNSSTIHRFEAFTMIFQHLWGHFVEFRRNSRTVSRESKGYCPIHHTCSRCHKDWGPPLRCVLKIKMLSIKPGKKLHQRAGGGKLQRESPVGQYFSISPWELSYPEIQKTVAVTTDLVAKTRIRKFFDKIWQVGKTKFG